ncbi:hypothetical protein O181_051889 [Austropuccinia psidii MF-1]|uniref:Amino acid transporter transmembrane domain-containing protein n=1 Tax=Austropuccinia psidii MF-1 TaxID=1389203 RepID=A0A9Q3DZN1_9BASI|nr:hypothetical protein [Austropuccinia psidii MF-1]
MSKKISSKTENQTSSTNSTSSSTSSSSIQLNLNVVQSTSRPVTPTLNLNSSNSIQSISSSSSSTPSTTTSSKFHSDLDLDHLNHRSLSYSPARILSFQSNNLNPSPQSDHHSIAIRSQSQSDNQLKSNQDHQNYHHQLQNDQIIQINQNDNGNNNDDDEDGEDDDEAHSQNYKHINLIWSKHHKHDEEDDQDENGERQPLVSDCDQPISPTSDSSIQAYPKSFKPPKKKAVYGGGRLDWGGELEIWQVSLAVASSILSPAPLFIPHAFLLLGLPIGLPVLFLIAFLAWFSHVILVLCGRYVGGRTYAQVASAVFPDTLKGFNLWFGESIVEIGRAFVAGGRGMVNMMMVSDLFAQLTKQYTPKAAILYSRVFIIALVALLSLIPNFARPRRPIFLPTVFPTLSTLPSLLTALWPIAIGIIAIRLRQLNNELGRKLPPTGSGDVYSEIMGGTAWGGFAILLFCLMTPQSTFTHLRSLKRINKPPKNPTHRMVSLAASSDEPTPISDPLLAGPNRPSIFSSYTLRRYSWESAAFFGVLYAQLICLGWGLVGYLGMEHGGYEVNFLASLPSNDPWISTSRVLLLIVLIPSIPLSLRPATTALFHLMRIPFLIHTASSRRKKLRRRGLGVAKRAEAEWDDEDEDEPLVGKKLWRARWVTIAVWVIVATGAIQLGASNGGEGSTIEILGCVGSTTLAGLLPAGFFVVLFHIRKARSIFMTDPRSPRIHNELLLRKELQIQKRLSGRRIWQDVGVFGLLMPFCLVVMIKGLITVLSQTGISSEHKLLHTY